MVCLMAQMILSMNNLNWAGFRVSKAIKIVSFSTSSQIKHDQLRHEPGKQCALMARKSLKNPARCSGNSEKSWLIIERVGSKIASSIAGTWGVRRL
jgi:hypothetical protein